MALKSKNLGQAKAWCWTSFELALPHYNPLDMYYIVCQEEEAPETHKHHLQGFTQFKKKVRFTTAQKMLAMGKTLHMERMRGTVAEAAAYCKKEESRVAGGLHMEEGKYVEEGALAKRTDLAALGAKIKNGATFVDLVGEEDTYQAVAAHPAFVKEHIGIVAEQKDKEELKNNFKNLELKDWQAAVVDKLDELEPRKVLWITDLKGGAGKSVLATWLHVMWGAFVVYPGRLTDMLYLLSVHDAAAVWGKEHPRVVVVDITRTEQKDEEAHYDPLDGVYKFVEQCKNFMQQSTKYACRSLYGVKNVVCLSNFPPNRKKLSEDRWDVMDLIGEAIAPAVENSIPQPVRAGMSWSP